MNERHECLVCHALTDDLSGLRIESRPPPDPGPGEVLVRVRAASVNFPDLLMTQGKYQFRPELPFVVGMEAAGEVVAIGPRMPAPVPQTGPTRDAPHGVSPTGTDDGMLKLGDRVLVHARSGAFAELIAVPDGEVRAIPGDMDFASAAAFSTGALTAYVALVQRAKLTPDEVLLVHGATGGVGMAAVQLGKHLGARVIATGTSAEKLAALRELEGVETIHLAGDLRAELKSMTSEHGADVIFDPVGGDVFDTSVRCVAWGGRLLVVGFASGRIPQLAVNLPLIKGFSVIGVRAGESGRRDQISGAQARFAVDELARERVFRPHVCAKFALADAVDALRMLAERRVLGKVVVEMAAGRG